MKQFKECAPKQKLIRKKQNLKGNRVKLSG